MDVPALLEPGASQQLGQGGGGEGRGGAGRRGRASGEGPGRAGAPPPPRVTVDRDQRRAAQPWAAVPPAHLGQVADHGCYVDGVENVAELAEQGAGVLPGGGELDLRRQQRAGCIPRVRLLPHAQYKLGQPQLLGRAAAGGRQRTRRGGRGGLPARPGGWGASWAGGRRRRVVVPDGWRRHAQLQCAGLVQERAIPGGHQAGTRRQPVATVAADGARTPAAGGRAAGRGASCPMGRRCARAGHPGCSAPQIWPQAGSCEG
jgi:hypothetical protein